MYQLNISETEEVSGGCFGLCIGAMVFLGVQVGSLAAVAVHYVITRD